MARVGDVGVHRLPVLRNGRGVLRRSLCEDTWDLGELGNWKLAALAVGVGEEFEPWLEPLLKQAELQGAKVVVTRGVRTISPQPVSPASWGTVAFRPQQPRSQRIHLA